jgi:hypothetical protein
VIDYDTSFLLDSCIFLVFFHTFPVIPYKFVGFLRNKAQLLIEETVAEKQTPEELVTWVKGVRNDPHTI